MIKKIRIIHLDDNYFITSLIQALLAEEGFVCDIARVETEGDFSALIERGGFDLVLAEMNNNDLLLKRVEISSKEQL